MQATDCARAARRRISLGATLAIIAMCLVPSASALAAPRSTARLRQAFGQMVLALRATGNTAMCSQTTPSGQLALIQMLRGEEEYLPSTTCTQAFAAPRLDYQPIGLLCSAGAAAYVQAVIKKAVIHVKGNRATIQLTSDFICQQEGGLTGSSAVKVDPLATTHWIQQHGRWLFDDEPTGTYSPSGRKAAAMLREALKGRKITVELPGFSLSIPFCANGTSATTIQKSDGETVTAAPYLWHVAAGFSVTSTHEPPFDAQSEPQGAVFVPAEARAEWNVKLVGGAPYVAEASGANVPISAPGAAGC